MHTASMLPVLNFVFLFPPPWGEEKAFCLTFNCYLVTPQLWQPGYFLVANKCMSYQRHVISMDGCCRLHTLPPGTRQSLGSLEV